MNNSVALIIGTVWPEPDSSAAGSRMMQLIQVFQFAGYKVVFASAAAKSEFSINLTALEVETASIELNNISFDEFVMQLNPSIVMFDRFMTEEQFGWRVAENCPDALRIIDTEDLHCLRTARTEGFKRKDDYRNYLQNDVAKREIAAIWRSDLSLIISEFEMRLLTGYYNVDSSLLHYIPFLADKSQVGNPKTYSERKHFITIGNFLHEPNRNSVLFLKEEIWPLIRKKLPEAELHIYGAYAAPRDLQLSNKRDGFIVAGRAGDVKKVMSEARVCLAPLRIGAGLKGKLLDAMLSGTPSVTTSVGAEGMSGNLPWSGLIADDAGAIAEAAVELYTNPEVWNSSVQNGYRIVSERYNSTSHRNILIERIKTVCADLNNHRKNNFTGTMLMHQSMQSTKYMSRWIEEKNRAK